MSELLILTFALVLFLYWFRYNCAAILRTSSSPDLAGQVADANHLSFPEVERCLRGEPSAEELDVLDERLRRDYKVLTCLLRYTSGLRGGGFTFEQRILMLDFQSLWLWYAVTRGHAPGLAKRSLEERSHILHYFAEVLGKRSATLSRA